MQDLDVCTVQCTVCLSVCVLRPVTDRAITQTQIWWKQPKVLICSYSMGKKMCWGQHVNCATNHKSKCKNTRPLTELCEIILCPHRVQLKLTGFTGTTEHKKPVHLLMRENILGWTSLLSHPVLLKYPQVFIKKGSARQQIIWLNWLIWRMNHVSRPIT